MQKGPLPPFSCSYSPQVPELLYQLGCSLAISTYQAGKVIFISPKNEEHLVQLPRTFDKAMGMGLKDDRMVLATKDEVLLLANSPELGKHYPRNPNTYDAFYIPRVSYFTGQIDVHDIDFGKGDEIYGVNTSFSCLIRLDSRYNFVPIWRPPFISHLVSEDRCHLNGMAMVDEKPKYVTAFNKGNSRQSWREEVTTAGILMDVDTDEILMEGLKMPHSPRIFNGELYMLFSATGELVRANLEKGTYEVVYNLNGFVRGMAKYGDYLFIGLSRLRKNSSTFAKLAIADKAVQAGIAILHLPTASIVGNIKYHTSVDEIYDVQVLPNVVRPGILNTMKADYKMGLSIPGATYWAKTEK